MAPAEVDPTELELDRWVPRGAGIIIGQCCAEPVPLVEALVSQAGELGKPGAFVGMSYGETLLRADPGQLQLHSYGWLGRSRKAPGMRAHHLDFSAIAPAALAGEIPGEVAFLVVSPPDADGRCSMGPGPDYVSDALAGAKVVIAEVNERCPRTPGPSIEWDRIDVAVRTERPLLEAPPVEPGEIERRIGENVASVIADGDTIQLGVGALPEAILAALGGHRDLGVHSGMISEGILDLVEAGVVTGARKPIDTGRVVTANALGAAALMDAITDDSRFAFRPVSYTHDHAVLASLGSLVTINSALEVDLGGNVMTYSERIPIGCIGGQRDFARGALAGGGKPVVALPAARIVEQVSGPAATGPDLAGWVVTEHGARDLRGLDETARRAALLEIAEPSLQERLGQNPTGEEVSE